MSKELYNLIKALNPTQKRLCSQALNAKDQYVKYIHLYAFIQELEGYCQEAIHRFIEENPELGDSVHHVIKTLRLFLLKTLTDHAAKDHISFEIQQHFKNAALLRAMNLYEDACTELDRGIKLAKKHQLARYVYEGTLEKLRIVVALKVENLSKELRALLKDLATSAHQIKSYQDLSHIYFSAAGAYISQRESPERLKKLLEEAKNLEIDLKDLDFDGKARFCFLQNLIYKGEDIEKAMKWAETALDLFGTSTHLRKTHLEAYINILDMYLNTAFLKQDWFRFEPVLREARKMLSKNQPAWLRTRLHQLLIFWEFSYWGNTKLFAGLEPGEIEQRTDLVNDMEDAFHSNRVLAIYYTAGILHFFRGQYVVADFWWEYIPTSKAFERRADIKRSTAILRLLTKYEIEGKYEPSLLHQIDAVRKRLDHWGHIMDHERLIINGLKKIINTPDLTSEQAAMWDLAHKLLAIRKQHPNARLMALDETLYWLGTKLDDLDTDFIFGTIDPTPPPVA